MDADVDAEKLEEVVLALLYSFKEGEGKRAWKNLPWAILDALYEKGYISDPANKNNSVWLTETGAKLSAELFEKLFVAV